MTKSMTKSIANCDPLTQKTFDDFLTRLRYDHVGDGVDNHFTANPNFIVQVHTRTYGLTGESSDKKMIYRDDESWEIIEEFLCDLDEDEKEVIDQISLKMYGERFSKLDEDEKWRLLEDYHDDFNVTRYSEEWVYVNSHMTMAAAEAFIKRRQHVYDELRIYVDSQYWCWEYTTIIEGLLSGKIKYVE